jgi:hypothetical protein
VKRRALLVSAASAVAAGCGYALQGRGFTTDPSIKRIGVPLFKDRTGKLGLDARITAAVVSELLKRGRFSVVKDSSGVDALVEGEILSCVIVPVSFTGGAAVDLQQASRYSITIVASVVYRKIGQQEPLWANEAFSQRDEYDMGESPGTYFDREDQSIMRLAEQFARSVVAAMLEAF